MIEFAGFAIIRRAAAYGHLDVLKHLITWYGGNDHSGMTKKMIQAGNFFKKASRNGHLEVVKHILISYNGDDRQEMIKNMIQSEEFYCFRQAARRYHWDVVKHIIICYDGDGSQEMIKKMVQSDHFCCFTEAARNGRLDVLKQILILYGERDDAVDRCFSLDIAADKAVHAQDVELLRHLYDWCSDEKKPSIFTPSQFRVAVVNGYLAVLQQFHAWYEQGPLELPRHVLFEEYRLSMLDGRITGRYDIEARLFDFADEKAKRRLKKLKRTTLFD